MGCLCGRRISKPCASRPGVNGVSYGGRLRRVDGSGCDRKASRRLWRGHVCVPFDVGRVDRRAKRSILSGEECSLERRARMGLTEQCSSSGAVTDNYRAS
ncbi:hypothetical protein HAX54_025090 [Datura stramonium]|uniref:Uncharacterized protein n=1 Tax=Datura stramonium TaxID=4076 RepID=A0ABS8UYX9_DATST|nr:hypothetical protein [Datura stramonium]